MRLAWKIFRAVVSVLLLLAVLLPVSLYVLLSLPPVQDRIRDVAATELSKTLGADVSIDRVVIHPFNRLSVSGVELSIDSMTVAYARAVSAGFELYHFLRSGELVIDYALIDGVSLSVWRDTDGAPLNVQPVLDHLRSDKPREDKAFDLRINTVILRNSALTYDVLDAVAPDSGIFCSKHIEIDGLALNAYIPRISNRQYKVQLDHLSFHERSGFELSSLKARANIGSDGLRVSGLEIELPSTHLAFAPLELPYSGFSNIKSALYTSQTAIRTSGDNYFSPTDFAAFSPELTNIDQVFNLGLDVAGNLTAASLNSFSLTSRDSGLLSLNVKGSVVNPTVSDSLTFSLTQARLATDGREIARLASPWLKSKLRERIAAVKVITADIRAEGSLSSGHLTGDLSGDIGRLGLEGSFRRINNVYTYEAQANAHGLQAGLLTGSPLLGSISAVIKAEGKTGRHAETDISLAASELRFKGYTYTGINAEVNIVGRERIEANLSIDDPAAKLLAYAFYQQEDGRHSIQATTTASGIDLYTLGLEKGHEDYRLSAKANVSLSGHNLDDMAGDVKVFDTQWVNSRYDGARLQKLTVSLRPDESPASITIDSDYLTGHLRGDYSFSSLVPQLKEMCTHFAPALFDSNETSHPKARAKKDATLSPNRFNLDLTLLPSQELTEFLRLPVHVLYDVDITAQVDSRAGVANIMVDAPYLRQGNRLLEHTSLFATMDTTLHASSIYATTQFPTKKGDMALSTLIGIGGNRLDTHIDWEIERAIPLNGALDFTTLLRAKPGKADGATFPLDARIDFNPGTINFGDEVWSILKSTVDIAPEELTVTGFGLNAGEQRIAIDGKVSAAEGDSLTIALANVALLPVFETLEIDKALIGGIATGTFAAKKLLSTSPSLLCRRLHVDSIGYQRCTIGDADIYAAWLNDDKSFYLDADITGLEGKKSHIDGKIFPLTEALDINFEADSVPVGFLKPFMEAFTSDISGRASGQCRLFGTFKEIDLEGAVMADNVKLKVDFTGTSYIATDSVIMKPGKIILNDVTIHDTEGHPALLNGVVEHTFFKEPVFRFDITDARNLLSYNTTAKDNPDWYGTIYGNGGASVSGYPGVVNINVAMSTAPNSSFTFVLSDRLDAEDYSFITFRDVTPDSLKVVAEFVDDTPEAVKAFKQRTTAQDDQPSQYNMDIRVDVTKDADMTLVMDPAGGDQIKAHGEGNLHMAYHSANNDLNIWGSYVLAEGSYRFTLQDIIIKDFTIKEGSEIKFDGDPYAVKTNLRAYYATNANLSDLDESFLQDKEIARTNVPVHALMKVSGDIRQPAIDFDLEFPTLTQDTYRKVRSIVSTSDMMNRQIIYLLALNRFYTPDYMASTTKGSELFSVASSTLSSQLGNMLGKLSDKWSIAPNLRSDRGDFSDVEVDVALTSRLLNNRLIFNGNFGYRDKSLNSNQFIGDFDIEYLLNKKGSWRLKAYNRYNDRNYYLRSAQTTQGIGILFRKDFDSLTSFLRRKKKEKSTD